MLTIKDAKEFRGLSNKERVATAADIGRKFSEGTALGKVAMLALGAGLDAKAAGDKAFKFDATFDAFASEYFSNASDGTLKTYRSAFGNWTKAGMHAAFDASELAVRVFNESKYALSARSGMLSKLLKDKPPTAKEYNAAKPKTQNNTGPRSLDKATAGLLTSVDKFGVDHLAKLDKQGKATFAEIRRLVAAFAQANAAPAPKTDKTSDKKGAEPTFADKRKALLADLAKISPATRDGVKTIQ